MATVVNPGLLRSCRGLAGFLLFFSLKIQVRAQFPIEVFLLALPATLQSIDNPPPAFRVLRYQVRIPDDADQRSGLMPITHSECRFRKF